MTDAWDPSIPSHKDLAHRIELGNGVPQMRSLASSISALKTVGFDIVHQEDLAERDDAVRWYYPLEGDVRKAQTFWDMLTCWRTSWSGKHVTQTVIWLMEKTGIAPKGTYDVGEALIVAAEALVAGGQTKVGTIFYFKAIFADVLQQQLFTPMLLVICRKPEA
jgi:sterol 24-C-methyltransferase